MTGSCDVVAIALSILSRGMVLEPARACRVSDTRRRRRSCVFNAPQVRGHHITRPRLRPPDALSVSGQRRRLSSNSALDRSSRSGNNMHFRSITSTQPATEDLFRLRTGRTMNGDMQPASSRCCIALRICSECLPRRYGMTVHEAQRTCAHHLDEKSVKCAEVEHSTGVLPRPPLGARGCYAGATARTSAQPSIPPITSGHHRLLGGKSPHRGIDMAGYERDMCRHEPEWQRAVENGREQTAWNARTTINRPQHRLPLGQEVAGVPLEDERRGDELRALSRRWYKSTRTGILRNLHDPSGRPSDDHLSNDHVLRRPPWPKTNARPFRPCPPSLPRRTSP